MGFVKDIRISIHLTVFSRTLFSSDRGTTLSVVRWAYKNYTYRNYTMQKLFSLFYGALYTKESGLIFVFSFVSVHNKTILVCITHVRTMEHASSTLQITTHSSVYVRFRKITKDRTVENQVKWATPTVTVKLPCLQTFNQFIFTGSSVAIFSRLAGKSGLLGVMYFLTAKIFNISAQEMK